MTDFGLARRVEGDSSVTQPGALVGTPSYMAPEQVSGRRDAITVATDVYGLGAILYAQLTGRPPHQGTDPLDTMLRVREREPEPPSRVRSDVPRDLETICMKALAKDPARRYGSAAELAADLRRWLAGEPILARPAGRAEKVWRWCQRNPGMAGMMAAVVLLLVGVIGTTLYATTTEAREQKHRALLMQLQLLIHSPHTIGWSRDALHLADQARRIQRTHLTQSLAAASLRGLDAVPLKHFENESASALVFDPSGKKLFLGGIYAHRQTNAARARLWDLATGEIELVSTQNGPGPVGFLGDTPVHLVLRDGLVLEMWDIRKNQSVHNFRLNLPPDQTKGWQWVHGDPKQHPDGPLMVMTPDATRVAAAAVGPDGKGRVTVWDGKTGKVLTTFEQTVQALAFSQNKDYLAGGDRDGQIIVWPLTARGESVTIEATRLEVLCLAFSPDGQLLAAGDSGATITSWEWQRKRRQRTYLGSRFQVFQVAFSPDGTLLASGGRQYARVWDATTGDLLLEGNNEHNAPYVCALAFSPVGLRLAHASYQVFHPASIRVLELQDGRGIRTLRGLSGSVEDVVLSTDGKLVGAISGNWQVGVWDSATGRLLGVFDIPRGEHVDNCALAFSRDNRHVAAASFDRVVLWDLATGKEEQSWPLPPGFCNALMFHRDGALLSLRAETTDGKERPYGTDFKLYPRVCQLRNLLEPDETKRVINTITEFNHHLHKARAAPDGNTFLVTGNRVASDGKRRTLRAYDARTGVERWSKGPWYDLGRECRLRFDPNGTLVVIFAGSSDGEPSDLLDLATGKPVDRISDDFHCMSPGAKYLFITGPVDAFGETRGVSLVRRGEKKPLLVLGAEDGRSTPIPIAFSPDGTFITTVTNNARVALMDLPAMQRSLSAIGLGW